MLSPATEDCDLGWVEAGDNLMNIESMLNMTRISDEKFHPCINCTRANRETSWPPSS